MRLADKLLQEIRNFSYEQKVRNAQIMPDVSHDVPYVCQFAKPEHAELSLKMKLAPVDDPHWKDTGAASPERYADWAFTMCGMASAAMVLEYFENKDIPPAELAEDALTERVYDVEAGVISGMKYKEFADWIRKHGLRADVYTRLSIKGIEYALSEGKLVIISVNPNIRGYDTAPIDQKGGHLVLVTGYDLNKDTISINNPSGFVSMNSQVNHALATQDFKKFYAGRGIVLSSLR